MEIIQNILMAFVDYFKGVGVILKFTFIFIIVPTLVYIGIMFTIHKIRDKFPSLFERANKFEDLLIKKIIPYTIIAIFLYYYWRLDSVFLLW